MSDDATETNWDAGMREIGDTCTATPWWGAAGWQARSFYLLHTDLAPMTLTNSSGSAVTVRTRQARETPQVKMLFRYVFK